MVADHGRDPDIDRGAACSGGDRRDPQDGDVGREGIGDERAQPEGTAESHRHKRPAPVGDGPPDEERERRRARGQDPDDPDVGERQVETIHVDDRVQRHRRDEAAAVEALGDGDVGEDRSLPKSPDGIAGGERWWALGVRRPEAGVREGADQPHETGQRHGGLATQLVRQQAAGERRDCSRRGPPRTDEADHAAADPGRVHRTPEAQVERPAQREAEPEDDRDRDHDRRGRQDGEHEQRRRAGAADERELTLRSWADPPRKGTEQVGDERRGGQRGEADRLETPAAGDRREEGRDERDRHADPDGRHEIERQVAPDRALMRRWVE